MSWQDHSPMRFAVDKLPAVGSEGMVVTNNPLGSAAGAQILADGGNAIDAGIGALFALTVVEPMMVGIFGAGMSTLRLTDGSHHFINNYARAPAAATPTMYTPLSNTWPDYQDVEGRANDVGVLAVGVPGTLQGWVETLEKHGSWSLADVLRPAIDYAAHGYRATQYLHEIVRLVADDLARFEESAKLYLPNATPIAPGERIVNAEYANTLRLVAQEGSSALYHGQLGDVAASYIQENGGILTQNDLASYSTVHTQTVQGEYRGYAIYGPAPPSAGGVHIVEMLNVLEGFDVAGLGFGTTDGVHLLIEVLKIGFEDRAQYTGDPDFVDVPVDLLTSQAYADQRRALIDMQHAREVATAYTGESNHTTHITTADRDGNVMSATHTIHSAFGSKATVPGTGMLLNNTMNIFDPHPGLANSIAPGKRMTSSMSPVILERDGKPVFALGCVGGTRIFPSVLQAIVNVIDHGMAPSEALAAPRIWTLGDVVELEPGFSDTVKAALKARGHRLEDKKIVGAGMGMIRCEDESLIGASCWRADGTPVALGGGMARAGLRFDV